MLQKYERPEASMDLPLGKISKETCGSSNIMMLLYFFIVQNFWEDFDTYLVDKATSWCQHGLIIAILSFAVMEVLLLSNFDLKFSIIPVFIIIDDM